MKSTLFASLLLASLGLNQAFADSHEKDCHAIRYADVTAVEALARKSDFNFYCAFNKEGNSMTALQAVLWSKTFNDSWEPNWNERSLETLRIILSTDVRYQGEDITPILYVNDLNDFKSFLSRFKAKGYHPNTSAETPLLTYAVGMKANRNITRWLIKSEKSIDINVVNSNLMAQDKTALLTAIWKADVEYVSLMTKYRKNLRLNYITPVKYTQGKVNYFTGTTAITSAFQEYLRSDGARKSKLLKIMRILRQAGANPAMRAKGAVSATQLRQEYYPVYDLWPNSDENIKLKKLLN